MGTAGSIKMPKSFRSRLLVLSGDAVCNFNYIEAKKFHDENSADVTMLLYNVQEPLEYGVVVCMRTTSYKIY